MNIDDIVYLKSSKEKMMVTWIDGISEGKMGLIDINKTMKFRPDYQIGEISVKFGKDKKATFPKSCLINNPSKKTLVLNSNIEVGNVVKHKLTDIEMTVIWIIGQEIQSTNIQNINKLYQLSGYKVGDIVCGYFLKKEYETNLFRSSEVDKIYE